MKYLFSYYLLLITLYSFADMPGNKPRPDYSVKITGLKEYKEYTFYSQGYDSAVILRDSSSIYIQGGFGAPMCVNVWAVQQKSNKHTDTLNFCSISSENDKAGILTIQNNHLIFTIDTTFNKSEKSDIQFETSIVNTEDVQLVKNRNIMFLISGLSFLVLITLIFFVWNKNRKSKNQQP